ncbi:hypothetical protein GRZ57_04385 [Sphaerochaeta halotolerans]|nr:hypothetical protein [Sphaerochaeta halotolerans]
MDSGGVASCSVPRDGVSHLAFRASTGNKLNSFIYQSLSSNGDVPLYPREESK